MAPRRAAPAEDAEEEEEQQQQGPEEGGKAVALRFNEPLSWRPGKPIPTDQLLKRLDRLSKELAEMEQNNVDTDSLVKVSKELASHQLLTHKDKGVRAYTACCVVDILRLCAPNAPFTPSQLKDIFSLCVNAIIPALFQPSNSYNNQHIYVLLSFAEIKSIVLLLDVEGSDSLLLQLFSCIFDGVSGSKSGSNEQITKDVEFNMQEVLGTLIDEATSLPAKVVDVIMAQFLRAATPGSRHDHIPVDDNQATLLLKEEPEAYQIAKNLCHAYPEKMSRFVSQYFSDVIMDATSFAGRTNGHKDGPDSEEEDGPVAPSEADLRELRKAHFLIRELWRAAPMILQNVVPQVDAELSADNVELRLLATETLGDMISGIGAAGPPPRPTLDPAAYPPLRLDSDQGDNTVTNPLTTPSSTQSFSQTHPLVYNNFISRKNDKTAAIRAAWTIAAGHILSTSAGGIGLSREEELVLVQGLGEKLNDSDEKVRLAAVKAIESFKFKDVILQLALTGGVSKDGSVLSNLADRCRDKRPPVRVEAMTLLGKLWGVGAGELLAGNEAVSAAISAIPSRIFNVFYANDPDLNALLDVVIYECLVPLSFPPPPKKAPKSANGASQSQSADSSTFDQDAIRAARILLLARSLDSAAKKAFFALQARQPQFSNIVETFIKQCELFNGGVMEGNAEKKTANLDKTILYISQFLADSVKTKADLLKFAKANDRRNYHLIRFVIGQEHDFKTVYKALKELTKRVQAGKEPAILDTLLPLLYRSGCFMFNRSHLPTFMDYSKSDRDGLGAIAYEILNEVSQRNPELFKGHIGDLCKDLVDQAPTAKKENDAAVVDSLKACASYSRKFPKEVPMDRNFIQTMISYALYGHPPKAAKYAVHILLSKKDSKSQSSGEDLLAKTLADWEYGGAYFLNKLTTLSQLELLSPKMMERVDEKVLNICVQQILLEVRAEASDKDPKWVDDADLDDECKAKCLALKILVNRLRGMEDIESAQASMKATWKLLKALISKRGELCKTKDTPSHHKSRLRLLAAKLILKLCTQKHFDDQLSPADFDSLAWIAQDDVMEVRHGFVSKLQKYLAEGKLRSRYYTIIFLMAFEPNTDFKHRVETWIRSRARHFEDVKQPVMEAIMPRLLSLLAHHPDYSQELDDLVDHARYLVFYISLVGREANLGLITKYAERVKQTRDTLCLDWDNHRVLCDLAQAVIRKWQERKNWAFEAYGGKVGLPVGLYTALQSHDEAQEVAEKQYVPEGIDEKLDELLRAIDRKKKRRSIDDHLSSHPPAKRAKPAAKSSAPREPKAAKPAKKLAPKPKKTPSRPKRVSRSSPVVTDSDRRRSARSRKSETKYVERDSSEDDEEMWEGVAEWKYLKKSQGEGSDDESEVESAVSAATPAPARAPKKKPEAPPAASATTQGSDDSELSELDSQEIELEEQEEEEESSPPRAKANGKRTNARGGARKPSGAAASKAKPSPKNGKSVSKAAPPPPGKSTRLTRRQKTKSDDYAMDESDD